MILGNIFPFLISEIFIISTAFFINFLNEFLSTLFFPSGTLNDSLYTIIKWRMDKYAQAFIIQNIIRASSDNYAVLLLRCIQNNLALKIKENIIHRNEVEIAVHLKFMIDRKTPLTAAFLINFSKQIKRNILFLSCNIDQFFVIKSKSKFFCQSLTDQTAITAEHSVYCNHAFTHNQNLLMTSLLLLYYDT